MYLGGDVNVTDSDGDTPLYVVENIETAKWLTDHGAVIDRQNLEGQTVSYAMGALICITALTIVRCSPQPIYRKTFLK